MPRLLCGWCQDDTVYRYVDDHGGLCSQCYDSWYSENVLPGLRRSQEEWVELRQRHRIGGVRRCDESLLRLSKREIRKIRDVELPPWDGDDGYPDQKRAESALEYPPPHPGPVQ